MSKSPKTEQITLENEAFEMIELALGDLDTLARAFNLISEVCAERDTPAPICDDSPPKNLLN
jgi:hypothetical protein